VCGIRSSTFEVFILDALPSRARTYSVKISVTKRVASQLKQVAATEGSVVEKAKAYKKQFGGSHFNVKGLSAIFKAFEDKSLEMTEVANRGPKPKNKAMKKAKAASKMSAKLIAAVKKAEITRKANKVKRGQPVTHEGMVAHPMSRLVSPLVLAVQQELGSNEAILITRKNISFPSQAEA
jgi:hypothetical protein